MRCQRMSGACRVPGVGLSAPRDPEWSPGFGRAGSGLARGARLLVRTVLRSLGPEAALVSSPGLAVHRLATGRYLAALRRNMTCYALLHLAESCGNVPANSMLNRIDHGSGQEPTERNDATSLSKDLWPRRTAEFDVTPRR
jgi:hypothetical protein